MHIYQVYLQDFGEDNICQNEHFDTNEVHFIRERCIFEALYCMFDPYYLDERVTKPNDTTEDSFIGLSMILKNKKVSFFETFNYNVMRFLAQRPYVVIDDNKKTLKEWFTVMRDFTIAPEPLMTSPKAVINDIVETMFRADKEIQDMANRLHIIARDILKPVSDQDRPYWLSLIEPALNSAKEIAELTHASNKSHRSNCKTRWEKMKKLTDRFRSKEIHYELMNICISTMETEICKNLEKIFSKSIQKLNEEIQAYTEMNDNFYTGLIKKIVIGIQKNQQLTEDMKMQLTFYSNDTTFTSSYKHDLVTTGRWEQNDILRKMKAEELFFDKLTDEIRQKHAHLEEIRLNIQDRVCRIRDVEVDLEWLLDIILPYRFEDIKAYILAMFLLINDNCEYLFQTLNNPNLDLANIKNCIGGLFLDSHGQPDFLFDNITINRTQLLKYVQSFLAPLCNVLYYNTSEAAAAAQERIIDNTVGGFETKFVFAGYDSVDFRSHVSSAEFRKLSKLRKSIGYKDIMRNLLTKLWITTQADPGRFRWSVLNLKTKTIFFEGFEVAIAFENENLFTLLRIIKGIYLNIANELQYCNEFMEAIKNESLTVNMYLVQHYFRESQRRSKMLELQTLIREHFNIKYSIRSLERLQAKSANRLAIYKALISIEDAEFDESRFRQTLSEQTTNNLLLEHVSLDEVAINAAINAEIDAAFASHYNIPDIIEKHKQNTVKLEKLSLEKLTPISNEWKEEAIFDIGHDDALRIQLTECVSIDLYDFAFLQTKVKYNRKLDRYFASPYNRLSVEDVNRRIDHEMSRNHLPMSDPAVLNKYDRYLHNVSVDDQAYDRIVSYITAAMDRRLDFVRSKFNRLCECLAKNMQRMYHNININVGCDVQSVDITLTNWSKHATKQIRKLQSAHFYLTDAFESDEHSRALAILLYYHYLSCYTMKPILLNKIFEGCGSSCHISLCEIFRDMGPVKNFVLIRAEESIPLERLQSNPNERPGAPSETVPDTDPNERPGAPSETVPDTETARPGSPSETVPDTETARPGALSETVTDTDPTARPGATIGTDPGTDTATTPTPTTVATGGPATVPPLIAESPQNGAELDSPSEFRGLFDNLLAYIEEFELLPSEMEIDE